MGHRTWTGSDDLWNSLDDHQKAAVMALMEADGRNPEHARNAAGAMVNRAAKAGVGLGQHVSGAIYQPTIEPAQQSRLRSIVGKPDHQQLTDWVRQRAAGENEDPVGGATHFLAHPRVMEALTAREPNKYRSWPKWTGYNWDTKEYKNQTMTDGSHAFLAPEGLHSVAYKGSSMEPDDARVKLSLLPGDFKVKPQITEPDDARAALAAPNTPFVAEPPPAAAVKPTALASLPQVPFTKPLADLGKGLTGGANTTTGGGQNQEMGDPRSLAAQVEAGKEPTRRGQKALQAFLTPFIATRKRHG